jgi:hypothetical protein
MYKAEPSKLTLESTAIILLSEVFKQGLISINAASLEDPKGAHYYQL